MKDLIQIFIKGTDGIQRAQEIESTATIKQLKDIAKEIFGQPVERLAFGGRTLSKDSQTLEDWHIKDLSMISVTLRLRGGQ